jgi:hypothetical protein
MRPPTPSSTLHMPLAFFKHHQMLKHQLPYRAIFKPLPCLTWPKHDLAHFRTTHFQPEVPVTLRRDSNHVVPAIETWFTPLILPHCNSQAKKLSDQPFDAPLDVIVPVEHTSYKQGSFTQEEEKEEAFERGEASLVHFKSWITQTLENPMGPETDTNLYLAQCDLALLPKNLRDDLPPPNVVTKAGKGDIYASSLWMGIPPTHTPLHKDPNPNILVQLAGKKTIRMLQPQFGKAVYAYTRRLCAEAEGDTSASGSSLRGEEMMFGLERKILDMFIWDNEGGGENKARQEKGKEAEMVGYETTLKAGDGVFIPKGWWHSVRGIGHHKDGINASVSCIQIDIDAFITNAPLPGQLVVSMKIFLSIPLIFNLLFLIPLYLDMSLKEYLLRRTTHPLPSGRLHSLGLIGVLSGDCISTPSGTPSTISNHLLIHKSPSATTNLFSLVSFTCLTLFSIRCKHAMNLEALW